MESILSYKLGPNTIGTAQKITSIALGLQQNPNAEVKDANGNSRIVRGRWIQYDDDNRPVKIIPPDGSVTSFAYDFEGNRVKKTIVRGSQTETTLFIGTIYEVTGSESIEYIYAGSQRVALKKNTGAVQYFLPDHFGGTNFITNASGSVVRSTKYMPFGSTYQTSGTDDNDHKFTGQRLDDTSGLYYYGEVLRSQHREVHHTGHDRAGALRLAELEPLRLRAEQPDHLH